MPPLAYFGIESSGVTIAIDLIIVFGVLLYLALIYWTYLDARSRIADPTLVGSAVAVSLFPFVGTLLYLILRPSESLEDARERELELETTRLRLHQLESSLCPHCDYPVARDFIRCPSCLRKLKERCKNCSRPLDRRGRSAPTVRPRFPGVRAGARRGARRASRSRADCTNASWPEIARVAGSGRRLPSRHLHSARSAATSRSATARETLPPGRSELRRRSGEAAEADGRNENGLWRATGRAPRPTRSRAASTPRSG